MKCFYCVAEMVEQQRFEPEAKEAVTKYEGTPVCEIHARRIADIGSRWSLTEKVSAS